MESPLTRPRALTILALITAAGGALRFYNLAWGAPYYHFHIDEHFVFVGADLLRRGMEAAATAPKFFMYAPLPMHLVNVVRGVFEALSHPLVLTVKRDEIAYMVLGRTISAAFGTATIPVIYAIAARLSGRVAGLLAAAFLAVSVLHLRDSHFFSVDASMTFFVMLTWLALFRMVERGDVRSGVAIGLAFAGALLCKYSAVFMAVPIAVAHVLSPYRPRTVRPFPSWGPWVVRGLVPVVVCVGTFLLLDPMVLRFFDKFRDDVRTLITEPLTGITRPVFNGHFADLASPRLYWFTNLLWWGVGPGLEVWSLAGFVWLLTRRRQAAFVSALVPLAYYAVAGGTVAPFVRYAIPLVVSLAVPAGVLSADLLRSPRWRPAGAVATLIVLAMTSLYAAAYMNVFRQPDSRLAASRWLLANVPARANILVEPSHNIPPTGSYLTAIDFNRDYVLWGGRTLREAQRDRDDFYHLYTLDTYVYLYGTRYPDDEKRTYIASRLAQVDWILMDDTFLQFYQHLPESENGVVKQYYRDLFAGRLGFGLVKTFKVYPAILGWTIDDDGAELTFRLFDHPRVFIFKRNASGQAHERSADPPRLFWALDARPGL